MLGLSMGELNRLTYLTMDSVAEGIGASQVGAYVERLARTGLSVALHSFEKVLPTSSSLSRNLADAGVRWYPHRFGAHGTSGGIGRVLRGAQALDLTGVVHARSDMSALSAMLRRCPHWIWDVRSL